jgi:acetolactate synthase I/II/III large subunit
VSSTPISSTACERPRFFGSDYASGVTETGPTGELLARALRAAGGAPIFTLNGGHIWGLYMGALQQDLKLVDVRHEQTAAFAAEGWARVTRECGVAAVTAGPGVTNVVSALAQARQNDSPVLVLGGRAPRSRWGMGSLQEIDHLPIVRSLVKSAETLLDSERAYPLMAAALRTASSGRTGPVFLDVPLDLFLAIGEVPAGNAAIGGERGAAPDPGELEKAARLLRDAERPAIVAGNGVWWGGAELALRDLAEAAGAPVVANGMARGVLPPHHALFASRARSTALGRADVVVVAGATLDFRLNFGQAPLFAEDARVVYVDVDDFRKHRQPAAALYGDVRAAVTELAAAAGGADARADWIAEVAAAGRRAIDADAAMAASDAVPIHPARLIAEVEAFAEPDAVVVGDGGDFVSFAGRLIHREQPGLWLDPGPYGCLGAGPGYAMAAKLAHPDRQVILLSGDGAFGFSAIEFDTLVRHRLPIICIVGNNGIWGLEKHPMRSMLGTAIATDLSAETRYDRLVESLGGYGELVERPEDIRPALQRARASGLPACLNVLTDPEAEYPRSAVLA